ncbi:hypothetical protein [Alcaligenes sp. WGS1538]|uniref:hypothetical protein n=1 Tax=Alcaligenes sp. WGS1538 TaxID=3366811 RepID=UPI00372D6344
MHLFYLCREEVDSLARLVRLAMEAGPRREVGFTPQELNLRAALEALEDPKLSELLAGARIAPDRYEAGLADEDYREKVLELETRDTSYLIDQLMGSYTQLPLFFKHLEF